MGKIKRGNVYRSGFEKVIAGQLAAAGVKFDFEPDKLLYLKRISSGTCVGCGAKDVFQKRRYTPDFKIGPGLYIEAKGAFVPSDRAKLILVKNQHPEIEIRIIFQRNNSMGVRRYADWANEEGFKYMVGGYTGVWIT
jgi:hypothetical protein